MSDQAIEMSLIASRTRITESLCRSWASAALRGMKKFSRMHTAGLLVGRTMHKQGSLGPDCEEPPSWFRRDAEAKGIRNDHTGKR